jgi:hypothetical protein
MQFQSFPIRLCSLVLLLLLLPVFCLAEADPARVEAGRKATAFVFVRYDKGGASGTAFCIDSSGLFVTNNHVVTDKGKLGKVTIVTSPGTKTAKIFPATVVAHDENLDLAILRINGATGLSALKLAPLARVSQLRETQEVMAPGFPLGLGLTVDERIAPEISINMGRITALRHKDSDLLLIQFDGKMNHGNSGGPLLDQSGNVIGYVFAGVEDKEINFAYPITFLRYFLAKSNIVLTPRALLEPEAARYDIRRLNRPPQAGRAAIPAEAARLQATRLLHEVFAKQYKDTTPKGRAQLVLDLSDRISATKNDDPAARYVMLTEARNTAMSIGDMVNALDLSETLSDEYQLNEIELLTEVITKPLPQGVASQQEAALGATVGLIIVEAAAARHAYPEGLKLESTVKGLAYRTHNPAVISSVAARLARVQAESNEFSAGVVALQKLKTTPTDPAANLAAARYYAFINDDFPSALPLFARGSDAALQAAAKADLAKPTKADGQKALGDLWWDQAAKEKADPAAADACNKRAAYWYQQSADRLTGLEKTIVDQRLATLSEAALLVLKSPASTANARATSKPITQPNTAAKNRVVDLLELTDVARDARVSVWHLEKRGLMNEPAKTAELRFPYKPPAQYDLDVVYKRTDGQWGTGLILTHKGKIFMCGLPNPKLHRVEVAAPAGVKEDQLFATLPPQTANGCEICIQFRNDRITVIVDGKTQVNYQASDWKPGERPSFLDADPVALGVVLWYGRIEISKAQVTEINETQNR